MRRFVGFLAQMVKMAVGNADFGQGQADARLAVEVIDRHIVDLFLVLFRNFRKLDADVVRFALGVHADHLGLDRNMGKARQRQLHRKRLRVGRLDEGDHRHAARGEIGQYRGLIADLAGLIFSGFRLRRFRRRL